MIQGLVDAALEPTIRLKVRDVVGQVQEVETLVDTGFNGFLTLPPGVVTLFGLLWVVLQQARLAGGVPHLVDAYTGTVLWDGQWRVVEIDAVDGSPMIGMAMLQGYELRIEAVVGGAVTITALP
jgi:clan AA aspartic protease